MRQAMMDAQVGDDVYHEDPTVIELEARLARLAGKEAGLFCVSGTLANQLALRAHLTTCPPYSVLVEGGGHVHCWEAGALAYHTGGSDVCARLGARWGWCTFGRLIHAHPAHPAHHTIRHTPPPQEPW
jgi:threonine aldolase